jgi:hypothetical protein
VVASTMPAILCIYLMLLVLADGVSMDPLTLLVLARPSPDLSLSELHQFYSTSRSGSGDRWRLQKKEKEWEQ